MCLAAFLGLAAILKLPAAEIRYTDSLSPDARQAAGLTTLNESQLAGLNAAILHEATLARQGNIRGFAGTFTGRRTAAEREALGIDKLTEEQRRSLDAFVATVLAGAPDAPIPVVTGRSTAAGPGIPTTVNRPSVHGSVTAMYGWGSGGYSAYGGALEATYHDPANNWTATTVVSNVRSSGGRVLTRGGFGRGCR